MGRAMQALALLTLAFGGGTAQAQPQPTDLKFFFRLPPERVLAYRVTEVEKILLRGAEIGTVRHSHRLDLTFGAERPDGIEATLTTREVKREAGEAQTLHYALAKAAEGLSFNVIIDRLGFVREVVDWPAAKARLAAALDPVDPAGKAENQAVLNALDNTKGANALGRALGLMSATYQLPFKAGAVASMPDFQGGSAFIFPGRTAKTRIVGRDEQRQTMTAEWVLQTDAAVAARQLGPQFLAMLRSIGTGTNAAGAEALLRQSLADGKIGLQEGARVVLDLRTRLVSNFAHKVTLSAGEIEREQVTALEQQRP